MASRRSKGQRDDCTLVAKMQEVHWKPCRENFNDAIM